MVSMFFTNHIFFFFLYSELLNFFVTFIFFVHIAFFIIIFSTNLWKKLKQHLDFFFKYFFTLVIIVFLLYFYKLYMSFRYNYVSLGYISLHLKNFNFFFFGDTLICLALFITVMSWIYLGERYLLNNIFFVMYFFVFIICTIGMVSTTNLLTMIVYFELLFLPSLFFVYKLGYSDKIEKTIWYLLVWTMTGSLLVLVGISYLYYICGSLQMNSVIIFKFSDYEKIILFWLFFLGFGVKIPVWPFHYWLTKVHVEAPTGFSIFLSGFLVKTAFYCFTFFYQVFVTEFSKNIMLAIVITGALDASLRMWSVTDIKRLIAFATIQEMNLILLFFMFLGNTNYTILNLFLLVHGIFSGFLFFLIDQIQKQYSTRQSLSIAGLGKLSPFLHNIIWIAILIFRGFPIFIKFFIEYELINLLTMNYYYLGCFFFFFVSFFGVIGFSRIWLSIIYGKPTVKNSRLLFRKDIAVSLIFIFMLTFLQLFVFLF